MEGFRAKDADRDRYVELIEAAYVDGQIGDADRELRVGRALSAETLDELQTLTRDLQRPAGFVAAADRPAPPRDRARGAGPAVALLLAGFVVFLVLGVVGAVLLSTAGSEQDSATSEGVAVAPDPVASAQATEVGADPFTMTAPEVRRFLRAYQSEFGTLDAWDVAFYPERVSVDVPVRGSRPRYETWAWDGTWERTSEVRATSPFHTRVVDLGRIGADRLIENIRTARRTLGVQRGEFTHAVLWDDDAVGPTLNIHVGNEFGENGYLRTTLRGDRVVLRLPYAP